MNIGAVGQLLKDQSQGSYEEIVLGNQMYIKKDEYGHRSRDQAQLQGAESSSIENPISELVEFKEANEKMTSIKVKSYTFDSRKVSVG